MPFFSCVEKVALHLQHFCNSHEKAMLLELPLGPFYCSASNYVHNTRQKKTKTKCALCELEWNLLQYVEQDRCNEALVSHKTGVFQISKANIKLKELSFYINR